MPLVYLSVCWFFSLNSTSKWIFYENKQAGNFISNDDCRIVRL